MAARRTAIVAGAFGAVGRTLVRHLEETGGWDVVGIGRRGATPSARARYLQVDLTDPAACARIAPDLPAADAIFFAAYVPRPSLAEEVGPNLAMLRNPVEAAEPRSPALGRVVLLRGARGTATIPAPTGRRPTRTTRACRSRASTTRSRTGWRSARRAAAGAGRRCGRMPCSASPPTAPCRC